MLADHFPGEYRVTPLSLRPGAGRPTRPRLLATHCHPKRTKALILVRKDGFPDALVAFTAARADRLYDLRSGHASATLGIDRSAVVGELSTIGHSPCIGIGLHTSSLPPSVSQKSGALRLLRPTTTRARQACGPASLTPLRGSWYSAQAEEALGVRPKGSPDARGRSGYYSRDRR